MGRHRLSPAAIRHAGRLRELCADLAGHTGEERNPAPSALAGFGHELNRQGGGKLMAQTYDAAIERSGYPAVTGASSVWTGIGGWAA